MNFGYLFIIVIIILSLHYLYYKFTNFKKQILVIKKYITKINGYETWHIIDKDNVDYIINTCIWKFGRSSDVIWDNIDENKEYMVTGYGINLSQLNLYQTIFEIDFKIKKYQ